MVKIFTVQISRRHMTCPKCKKEFEVNKLKRIKGRFVIKNNHLFLIMDCPDPACDNCFYMPPIQVWQKEG